MTLPVILQDDEVLDFLDYASYRAQRYGSPYVTPERWEPLFPNWEALEARFQVEKAEYEAVVMKKFDSWICDRGAHA